MLSLCDGGAGQVTPLSSHGRLQLHSSSKLDANWISRGLESQEKKNTRRFRDPSCENFPNAALLFLVRKKKLEKDVDAAAAVLRKLKTFSNQTEHSVVLDPFFRQDKVFFVALHQDAVQESCDFTRNIFQIDQ